MALESLALLESEPWSEGAAALGRHLEAGLVDLRKSSPRWGANRGLGLMQGIEILDDQGRPDAPRAGALIEAMLARGLILLGSGVEQNILSFTPPFVITEPEIDFALAQLADAVPSLA
jgi:4-aminobutyrate aminotransferase